MTPAAPRIGLNSVRTRLMLWNVGIVALVLAAMGSLVSYTVRAKLMASVVNDLRDRVGRVGPPRPGPGPEGEPGPPDQEVPPPRFPGGPDGAYSGQVPRVFDLDGRGRYPFQEESPWDAEAFSRSAEGREVVKTVLVDGEPFLLLSRPRWPHRGPPPPEGRPPPPRNQESPPEGERPVDIVQAIYPLLEVNRSLAEMNRALLTLIPVALALSGAGGAWLTDRALRPVRRITQTAARIGAADLRQRLPLTGGDEFSELSGTINGMLERLQVAFSNMETLVDQQRRFTADASHELKTPLTVIKANSSLALATDPNRAGYREAMEEIDHAANSMNRLVQDLLLLARADEAQAGQNRTAVPVLELLQSVSESAQRPGYAPVRCRPLPEPIIVWSNRVELERILVNLVENALRHTPADGRIELACAAAGGVASLLVTDSGVGISAEHLPHLCERFYRTDTSRARVEGGSGLGLAICKSLAEANGGSLRISSQVGRGTTVTITVPEASSTAK